jgi:hypothetical protein
MPSKKPTDESAKLSHNASKEPVEAGDKLAYSSILKMEVIYSFEASFCQQVS